MLMRIIAGINLMEFIIFSGLSEDGYMRVFVNLTGRGSDENFFRLLSHALILIFIYNKAIINRLIKSAVFL
jgi:hypothetical protein